MNEVLVDVNIPMYAAGSEHPLRRPSQAAIRAIARGDISAVTDAEVLQEILYRYLHLGLRETAFRVFDAFDDVMAGRVVPINRADVTLARQLAESHGRLGARDLIHLAVMKRRGLTIILSTDRHFDGIEGIERWDPVRFS